MEDPKIVVVTGCNKGIGYGLVENLVQKNFKVIMACRNLDLCGKARSQILEKYNLDSSKLDCLRLDISDSSSIDAFKTVFAAKWQQADILINNAAIAIKGLEFDEQIVEKTLKTNFYGTIELTQKFIQLLKPQGKIVTIGSRLGSIDLLQNEFLKSRFLKKDINKLELFHLTREYYEFVKDGTYATKGWPKSAYGMSKLAIRVYDRILSRDPSIVAKNIQVYSCSPGFVNTDMTSGKGVLTVEQGCVTPIWLVELPHIVNKQYQGQLFFEQKILDL